MTKSVPVIIFLVILSTFGQEDKKLMAELEITDIELQDNCEEITNAKKNAIIFNSFKEKIEADRTFGNLLKTASKNLKTYENIPYDVQRNWTIITKPGDFLLPPENYTNFVQFYNTQEELLNTVKIPCNNSSNEKSCGYNKNGYQEILENSKDFQTLQETWTTWQEAISLNKEEFPEILDLVNTSASLNGQDNTKSYWEMLVDQENSYEKAEQIWTEIEPFYGKLHDFVRKRLISYYNLSSATDEIPVYLLGSNFGDDWSFIADYILPHPQLHYDASENLERLSPQDIYRMTENTIKNLQLKALGPKFWSDSHFNTSSCGVNLLTHCYQEYSEVLTCSKMSWTKYLDVYESALDSAINVADPVSEVRRKLRFSAIDEALVSLGTILAVENLPQNGILSEKSLENGDAQMTKLLLLALRIVPKLPYYLAADKWRLGQFENSSTENWWEIRRMLQKVEGVTCGEHDFLGDSNIISNKPYLSKFFGLVLQFQILEYYRNSMSDPNGNLAEEMGKDDNFHAMLHDRPSNDWSYIINLYYGIYEVSATSLLDYFRPLEEYLENAPLGQQEIVTTTTGIPTTTETTTTELTTKQDAPNKIVPETILNDDPKEEMSKNLILDSKIELITCIIGFGMCGTVAMIIVASVLYKKMRKRRRRPNNRRFET